MRKWLFLLFIILLSASFSISQVQYSLKYLEPGFHISYVANYPVIEKVDGCDDVLAGLDLNKNGKYEIVAINDPTVSNPSSGDTTKWVFWFENNGDDSYQLLWSAPLPLDATTNGYSFPGVNITDVDGDGNPEITVVNPSITNEAPKIFFYEFDPQTGTFPNEPTFSWNFDYPGDADSGFRPTYLIADDFDGDGKQEIAWIDRRGTIQMWVISLVDNDLNPFSTFNVEFQDSSLSGSWAFDIAVTDFDNDGKKEIWFGTWTDFSWEIVEAEGPDNYVIKKKLNLGSVVGTGTVVGTLRNLKFMDMNGDGYPEGFAVSTNGRLVFIENKKPADVADIDSTYFHNVGGWDYARGADFGDLDGDGNLDIIAAGSYSNAYHIEYKGSGSYADSTSYTWAVFLEDTLIPVRYYYVSMPGKDMDGDSKREVVIGSLRRFNAHPDSVRAFFIVFESDVATGLNAEGGVPVEYYLGQNYPNPFNPLTRIDFVLPRSESVVLKIYTLDGREVKTLIDGEVYEAGKHTVYWDGTDNYSNRVASGVYLYRFKAGNFEAAKKMILIK